MGSYGAYQPTSEEVARTLDKAVELMNDSGKHWIKGRYVSDEPMDDGRPGYCSVGAIEAATRQLPDLAELDYSARVSVQFAAVKALATAYGRDPETWFDHNQVVINWNDRSDTTWDKIVKRFERAKRHVLQEAPDA